MLQRIQEQQNLGLFIRSKSKPLPREHPEKQYIIQTKWESPTFRVKKSLVYSLLDTGWRSVDANLFNFVSTKTITKVSFAKIIPCGSLKQKTGRCMSLAFWSLSCLSGFLEEHSTAKKACLHTYGAVQWPPWPMTNESITSRAPYINFGDDGYLECVPVVSSQELTTP